MTQRTIWKYTVEVQAVNAIKMPAGATILGCNTDPHGVMSIWCKVDPQAEHTDRTVAVRGTGQTWDDDREGAYIGSVAGGAFVWHLYDLGEI